MRYARHRFILAVLMGILPFVAGLAFIQTDVVSDMMLKFALRVARFRTGVKIDARAWTVSPFAFSAGLEDVSITMGELTVKSSRFEIQVSPVALLLGQLHLRDVVVDVPSLSGRIDPKWLESDDDGFKGDIPTELGHKIEQALQKIQARNVSIDEFTLLGAHADLDMAKLDSGDLHLTNLEGGQVSLEWEIDGFELLGKLARIEEFRGSASLLKGSKDFYMVIPTFEFVGLKTDPFKLEGNGRWPGDFRGSGEFDLAKVNEWALQSPLLKERALKNLQGHIKFDANFSLQGRGLRSVKGSAQARALVINDFYPNDIDVKVSGSPKDLSIDELRVHLPLAVGDRKNWKNLITGHKLRIKDGEVSGSLQLDEAGLCGILKGSSVKSCHTSLAATGPIPFSGTLKPLRISADPDLKCQDSRVGAGAFGDKGREDVLLGLQDHILAGHAEVTDKMVELGAVRIEWPDGSKITTDGRIEYDPSLVELDAETTPTSHLEKMFKHFIDMPISGKAALGAKITYSEKIPKSEGQTQVVARANIVDVGLEGQTFGTLAGPVTFNKDTLRFGPFRLVSGGGRATVDGSLVVKDGDEPSFLSLGGVLDRLELTGVLPESKSEIFRGFVSGTAQIQGSVDKTRPDFLSGPLNLKIDTFRAFGVPFQKATIKARYAKTLLNIESIHAQRDRSSVNLKGVLNPVSGTELEFESDAFPIRDLGLDPKLEVVQTGVVEIKGYWRPAQGWGLKGHMSQLRIAGQDLPSGDIELSGTDQSFVVKADLPRTAKLHYEERGTGANAHPAYLSCHLQDKGFYAAFAYLKGWTSNSQVNAKGDLEVAWSPREGYIRTKGLTIDGPEGADLSIRRILTISSPKTLGWANGRIVQNNFSFEGPTAISTQGAPGDRAAIMEMSVPLPVLDLFIPNIRFQDGRVQLMARIPMPPDLSTLEASGAMQGGMLLVRGIGQPLKSTTARLELSRQRLSITDGRGTLGGGSMTLSGVYNLDPQRPGLSLQMNLNRANLIVMDDVPTDVTGMVTLKGEDTPYDLAGRVQVSNTLYAKEFKPDEAIVPTAAEPILKFGLDIELGSNVRVKNSLASAVLSGRLFIGGTDLVPNVQGAVTIPSGSVFANESEFKIAQGNVNFPGGAASPYVGLQASTVVKYNAQDYKIDMRARGPVDNLDIEFTSDPALATPDIVNLLAFGVIRSAGDEGSTSDNTDLVNAARVEAFQALFGSAIGKGLDKSTGFQVRFKASPDLNQKELVPKLTVMRKLTERATVTYGQSLSKSEQNVEVDYKLLNNVNLTGVWESQESGVSQKESAVGADLRFRFDIK